MKTESRRIDSSTATTVTTASSANAATPFSRPQRACEANTVENRMTRPAASSALAVTAYRRATRISQPTRRPMPVSRPIAIRTGG